MKKFDVDIPRLCTAMQQARLALRRFREERTDATRLFVGRHYSEEGSRQAQPVNMLAQYVSIIGRTLIAKNPRVMFSTFDQAMKPAVKAMSKWANRELVRMQFDKTMQRVVTDALFSIGIAKVSIATPEEAAIQAWGQTAGQPLVSRIDLDDFVFDIHARAFEEVGYIGHRYRIPFEVAKNDRRFDRKMRKDLQPSDDPMINKEGDERVSMIGRSYYSNQEEYEDFIDLWEVYLPRHRLVVTLVDDMLTGPDGDKEPLCEQQWIGHELGPYHILGFSIVPGNAMPKSPIMDLVDLHQSTNDGYRKLMRNLTHAKSVTLGDSEDMERIVTASDGDAIKVNNPDRIKEIQFRTTLLQTLMLVAPHMRETFSKMANNLDLMGGGSAQAPTAHQDEMLNQNSGLTVAEMQKTTVDYVSRVLTCLGWYWWHDPRNVMRATHSPEGMPEIRVTQRVYPAGTPHPDVMKRNGRFEDLELEVDPYSMQHGTPQSRWTNLLNFVKTIMLPMAQQMQSQGLQLDMNHLCKLAAEYLDMPDLQSVITMAEPPPPQAPPGQGGTQPPAAAAMQPETTRNYVRQSMPTRTDEGNRKAMVMGLMGQNPGGQQNGQA
jgi:hypothetical protein